MTNYWKRSRGGEAVIKESSACVPLAIFFATQARGMRYINVRRDREIQNSRQPAGFTYHWQERRLTQTPYKWASLVTDHSSLVTFL